MTTMEQKAWLVSVDMGYGHQRAAHALRGMAFDRIITANSDQVVEPRERRRWRRVQGFYEGISRISGVPVVGGPIWSLFDGIQHIASLYPHRDLSRPTLSVLYQDALLRGGIGRSVVDYAKTRDIPFVSTFFMPALAAARAGLKNVFCVVTDTDISRAWVAREPAKSSVVYLAPTDRSRLRLIQYGVPARNVFLTGFPLPEENLATVTGDLRRRIARLDPRRVFITRYRETIDREIGEPGDPDGPVTITYSVGGAGAQREVAAEILASLASSLRDGSMRLNLVAGTRLDVRDFFVSAVRALGLDACLGGTVRILCTLDQKSYFELYNEWLRETDILWTKPSELVFYTALGLPLLMSSPLGAHEEKNRNWVSHLGAGFTQENPRYAAEWLARWIERGMLAEAAFHGYVKAPRHGTENIRRVVFAEDRSQVELEM
jgi:hypothetical protein